MQKTIKVLGAILVLLVFSGGIVYFLFPKVLVDLANASYAKAAQLEKKQIEVDGYLVNYYESTPKSNREILVLVHGMGDDKNSFLRSAELLSHSFHLILPDLAGHGENEQRLGMDYSIYGQSTFLHSFLLKLGVHEFDLVGNSMGGHTAAAYAIKYPKEVKKLVLLNAAGLKIDDHVTYTGFGKTIENDEDFDRLLNKMFYKIPEIPAPIRRHMINTINDSKDFVDNTLITAVKNGKYFNLKDDISKIIAPTLVLWGKHDKVVNLNAAEYFENNIPGARLQFIENAGHSPQLEVPLETAQAIENFLLKTNSSDMTKTREQHLAKVQLYRWYQLYERQMNTDRINNQLEILTEDVSIKSVSGEMKGKSNYPERLSAYDGWKNAHHVKDVSVVSTEEEVKLEADIHYQNIRPDGVSSSYTIHYHTSLEKSENELPQFSSLEMEITSETDEEFKDAYPENRAKSLMHYWLANMESLDGKVAPFEELLAEGFTLNFSTSDPINTVEGLEKWLNGSPLQLKESSHSPKNFSIKTIVENEYEMSVEFEWEGVTKEDTRLKAVTKHTWYIVDNPNDRFAKILKVDVSQIQTPHEVK
ncbi:alpha/beta fold hydrolase [Reichenbachiella versicolor]|uniref:alpha/beta fold hydrolase n=1 Tax=Reichenbachiella versicolor TaxID=1821036 RepID=UPI000D6E7EC7|nr:alpha/beta hydrolase [Reichenbachiella versicolor]